MAPDDVTDVPSEADVVARLAELPSLAITARDVEVEGADTLMDQPEPAVEVASEDLESDDAFIAPTMLTFENGARVVLNPTMIVDNSIYFSAISPGGLSLVPDADVPEAQIAVEVVTTSGIGDFDAVDLDRALSGAAIELYPSIDQTSEGFFGSSTTEDLELLLQMVNLYMSAPRIRHGRSRLQRQVAPDVRRRPDQRPGACRVRRLLGARWGTEPRYRALPSPRELPASTSRPWSAFARPVHHPGDWVFALSGDFDIDDTTNLAHRTSAR